MISWGYDVTFCDVSVPNGVQQAVSLWPDGSVVGHAVTVFAVNVNSSQLDDEIFPLPGPGITLQFNQPYPARSGWIGYPGFPASPLTDTGRLLIWSRPENYQADLLVRDNSQLGAAFLPTSNTISLSGVTATINNLSTQELRVRDDYIANAGWFKNYRNQILRAWHMGSSGTRASFSYPDTLLYAGIECYTYGLFGTTFVPCSIPVSTSRDPVSSQLFYTRVNSYSQSPDDARYAYRSGITTNSIVVASPWVFLQEVLDDSAPPASITGLSNINGPVRLRNHPVYSTPSDEDTLSGDATSARAPLPMWNSVEARATFDVFFSPGVVRLDWMFFGPNLTVVTPVGVAQVAPDAQGYRSVRVDWNFGPWASFYSKMASQTGEPFLVCVSGVSSNGRRSAWTPVQLVPPMRATVKDRNGSVLSPIELEETETYDLSVDPINFTFYRSRCSWGYTSSNAKSIVAGADATIRQENAVLTASPLHPQTWMGGTNLFEQSFGDAFFFKSISGTRARFIVHRPTGKLISRPKSILWQHPSESRIWAGEPGTGNVLASDDEGQTWTQMAQAWNGITGAKPLDFEGLAHGAACSIAKIGTRIMFRWSPDGVSWNDAPVDVCAAGTTGAWCVRSHLQVGLTTISVSNMTDTRLDSDADGAAGSWSAVS